MQKTIRSFIFSLALATAVHAQPANTPIANTEFTHTNGQKVLLGRCSPSIMQQGIYREWYERSYGTYTVDKEIAGRLRPLLKEKEIEIFAGSWCSDTRREIPRLMKILQEAGADTSQLTLIFVDNSKELYKQSPQHEEAGKAIHRIPTIVVYDKGREVNRIVEKPVRSLEQDLLDILSGDRYIAHYYATTYWQRLKGTDKALAPKRIRTIAKQLKGVAGGPAEFNGYSIALSAQGRLTEATNVLEVNKRLFPEDPMSYISLGKLYSQSSNITAARENLERALALQPGNSEARELLEKL